jgi:hypothetical protein
MPRFVREGSATALYRLLPSDLSRDIRHGFLRRVDLSGHDLSRFDLQHMTLVDCVAQNVILPDGDRLNGLSSRNTDWKGATIPRDVSASNLDLVREVLRQARPALPTRTLRSAADRADAYLSASYGHSWVDAYRHLIDGGMTPDEVAAANRVFFAGYPGLIQRSDEVRAMGEWPHAPRAPTPDDPIEFDLLGRKVSRVLAFFLQGHDPYTAARALRAAIEAMEGVAVRVRVYSLDPPMVKVLPADNVRVDGEEWA